MSFRVIESSLLNERLYTDEINGLPLYVMVRPGYAKKFASFATHFGSVDTCFLEPKSGRKITVPDGIAHFLEHKMFESEDDGVMNEFSRIGASTNAYTDYNTTSYVFSASDNFERALDLLVSFVRNPHFSEKGVEKEKPIIEQELRMYSDMPSIQVEQNLMEALYHHNPVRSEIGGTIESVRSISLDDLSACYETFYQPSNMMLFVAGDVEPEAVARVVRNALGEPQRGVAQEQPGATEPPRRIYPEESLHIRQQRVEKAMSVSTPLCIVGLKDNERLSGRQLLKRQATGDILFSLLFGRSSEAYERLYQQKLISEKFSASYEAELTYSHAAIGGESPEPERLAEAIKSVLHTSLESGLREDDVARLKKKAMGEFVALFNSLEYTARVVISVSFKGATVFDYYDALQQVTCEDAYQMLGELAVPERMAVSIMNPLRE